MISKLIITILITLPLMTSAKISVVTTTTDIKWLVEKIGGEKVKVESLLNGNEDPHYMDAMPHFVGKVANADMFCLVGMDLEVGWAPKVLTRSGNRNVQPGGTGYCETGKTVNALDIPKGKIDRSQGDVHSAGNPHYHMGPKAYLEGAETVLNTLLVVDAKNTEYYLKRFKLLEEEILAIKKEITLLLIPLKNKKIMEYHKEYTYFLHEYDLKNMGSIEKVPGVPPSAGRLARVSLKAKESEIYAILATRTAPSSIIKKFSEISKTPIVITPLSILKDKSPKNYRDFQLLIANKLLNATQKIDNE